MKIVIAIDSFKGCLTSEEANQAATEGIRKLYPSCEIISVPVADGGEGTLQTLLTACGGKIETVYSHNALLDSITADYGISADGSTAFIEMAAASGLPLIAPERRNPMETTTYGTGELIRDALDKGCRNFIIGLGGSATNDAGLGMLQALGYHFQDRKKKDISDIISGKHLSEIRYINTENAHPDLAEAHFTAACDVNNPFSGVFGAAYTFAEQKGGNIYTISLLDKGLKNIARIVKRDKGLDLNATPGAGAAGGLGGGLLAFLHADLKPGIELLLNAMKFDEKLSQADLVITGEGKADRQTLMGKVPSGILHRARSQNIPTLLIAGQVNDTEMLKKAGFKEAMAITPADMPLQEAMKREVAMENIRKTVEHLLTHL